MLLFFSSSSENYSILVVEEFLHVDLEVIRDGVQASAAFARNFDGSGAGDQNSFVHGLKPQVQLDIRSLPERQ